MESFDGAEMSEIVGIYLLSKLMRIFNERDVILYHHDGNIVSMSKVYIISERRSLKSLKHWALMSKL